MSVKENRFVHAKRCKIILFLKVLYFCPKKLLKGNVNFAKINKLLKIYDFGGYI